MKKILLLLCVMPLFFVSCGDDDDDNGKGGSSNRTEMLRFLNGDWKPEKIQTSVVTNSEKATQYIVNYLTAENIYKDSSIGIDIELSDDEMLADGHLVYMDPINGGFQSTYDLDMVNKKIVTRVEPKREYVIKDSNVIYESDVPFEKFQELFPGVTIEKIKYRMYYKKVS